MITVQPKREAALKAGFRALGERMPAAVDYDKFKAALESWDVKAFCRGDEAVGMLMVRGNELHVAVVPEVRGKWLSRRLIREVISPLLQKHGEAKTSVMPDNGIGRDFVKRLGFSGNDIAVLRQGFDNLIFDPVTALVGGTVASAAIGGLAADRSSSQAAQGTRDASANQVAMFNVLNDQSAPYRQAGYSSLKTISDLMPQFTHSFNAADLNSNLAPNYQFQLEQGLGAIRNAGNMQTGLISGNTLRGINDYAQNFAGNAYQQAFNNYNSQQSNIFNRLAAVAGLGQTANQTTANSGTNIAGNIGAAQIAGGQAQAAGTVGQATAISGGLTNAASWYALPKFLNYGSSASGAGLDPSMMVG